MKNSGYWKSHKSCCGYVCSNANCRLSAIQMAEQHLYSWSRDIHLQHIRSTYCKKWWLVQPGILVMDPRLHVDTCLTIVMHYIIIMITQTWLCFCYTNHRVLMHTCMCKYSICRWIQFINALNDITIDFFNNLQVPKFMTN